ncbi:DUF1190 domain-containing protein [Phaeovibrio sulfidiphilus]|uniref:DUF1190 domain-containing protein n=1 Tax=Phaeovibrio sulfidiphilus TaxID=1220600 RepID=A0A8J6YQF1_9PROT|nr:DUF1190 domain-containing protein [Phaeovibrio sulfidiphilus]MBE1237811.1 DUF1190 domain-containing protein [Phaeovibrio sulfidiphilus]
MKRSKSLSLLLMGSVALGVSACDSQQDDVRVFSSIQDCIASDLFSYSECKSFMDEALSNTPAFTSQADCEAQFGAGACQAGTQGAPQDGSQVVQGSGSMWMPMLAGFMAGHFLSRGMSMAGSQGLYKGPDAQGPAKAGTAGTLRTATGDPVKADSRGRVSGASPKVMQSMTHNARPAMGRSGMGTRGGFSGGGAYGGGGS